MHQKATQIGNAEVYASELKYLTTPDQSGYEQISRSQLFFFSHWIAWPCWDLTNKTKLIPGRVLETRDGRVT